jgi:phage repressor protein C with HTH and peptisase S24 domain
MSDHETIAFSKRLNEALDLRSYPSFGRGRISYVQEIFQLSRAGANKWLHGKAIPHPKKRQEIATKLGVSLTWLETGKGSPQDRDERLFQFNSAIAHEIPLLNLRQAYQYQDIVNKESLEKMVVTRSTSSSALAIKNTGSAMEPKFSANALFIVDTAIAPEDGDYVIAKMLSFPEAIVRQYIKGAEQDYLVAINSKFEPIQINSQAIEIIGKIIEVRSSL